MINACIGLLFGCLHRKQTRPFTLNKTCYTVCLDCGRELPYSWPAMRPMKGEESTTSRPPVSKEVNAAA